MINVEDKVIFEAGIELLENRIRLLQGYLLDKQRELWWLQRPHIANFGNEWYYESSDDGGHHSVWQPHHIDLSQQWLSIVGNQAFIDRQLDFITKEIGEDYDEDKYPDFLICGLRTDIYCEFCDDSYPDFVNAPDTVKNPNYHE